jgi:DNA-binding Lrp family transcriptional regulator
MRKVLFIGEEERAVIRALQGDIPICERPFQVIGERLGIPEERLISIVQRMKDSGIIRRFGATLRHQQVGYRANAMSAWRVPPGKVEEVGRILAALPQVTHCYEREVSVEWPYNIYAMIHCKDEKACEEIARRISRRTGINDYLLLFSSHENKKESMQYF